MKEIILHLKTIERGRLLLSAFYCVAGVNHFVMPDFYYPLIPDYLPFPTFINAVAGIAEIAVAIGVLIPRWKEVSLRAITILLLLFIPSHIHFIIIGSCVEGGLCVPPWVSWGRLLIIHPFLIFWALRYSTLYSATPTRSNGT